MLANFMSCLKSSLHENENYVKQNLVFVHPSCFIPLGASVNRMSHLSATTGLEFLLKYTADVDCAFFFLPVFLTGFSLFIFYHVFVLLPGYKHSCLSSSSWQMPEAYIRV